MAMAMGMYSFDCFKSSLINLDFAFMLRHYLSSGPLLQNTIRSPLSLSEIFSEKMKMLLKSDYI